MLLALPRTSLVASLLCLLGATRAAHAQVAAPTPEQSSSVAPPPTPAPEPTTPPGWQSARGIRSDVWSVFTQATWIDQWHGGFPAAYDGPNSLSHTADKERTFSYSLFLDRRLWRGAELIFNPEIFQGHGLSDTLGVAGFPNGEAVKSGFPHLHYNTSRLFFRQVIGLGGGREKLERDVNQVSGTVDVNRLIFSIGQFSANDFFDDNAYAHDPRTQFMNWSLWESTAWDYPADAVGFTSGGVIEWNTANTTLHYGIFLEPDKPNGTTMDTHVAKAHGQILQFDDRYQWGGRSGTVRPFVYWNQADMGGFALATEAASVSGRPADIAATRAYRSKVGFGVSWDQALTAHLGAFARLSWSDGRTESWAFTQVDRSLAAGLSLQGGGWGRPADIVGLGIAVDGLASEQRDFLAAGGAGLIVGDGALRYGLEQIAELYYSARATSWLWLTLDAQYVEHPGYNRDRGGVAVYAVRTHLGF